MNILIIIALFISISVNNACRYQQLLSSKINKREVAESNNENFLKKTSTYNGRLFGDSLSINLGPTVCDKNYKYRSFDGSCNNIMYPTMGMVSTKYGRFLPAVYSDGTHQTRLGSDGKQLPEARKLSTIFFPDENKEDEYASLLVMQFGQFLTHDVAFSIPQKSVDCCQMNINLETYQRHCLPILIPHDDKFYSQYRINCTNFVRTFNTRMMGDLNNPAEQLNAVTHMIDGSQIYGLNQDNAERLRQFTDGQFASDTLQDGRKFLLNDHQKNCFNSSVCYVAGDERVNQNPQLSILHILFMREHNRIAKELSLINPSWTDEILYQEARAIVISQIQHIIYRDLLPFYISEMLMRKYSLYPQDVGYITYKPSVNLNTINSFTTAAFRVLHTAIQGNIQLYNSEKQVTSNINISDYINLPQITQTGNNFDELLLGLVTQPIQKVDEFYSTEITEKLFKFSNPFGIDLEAFDIQRGRDHGIPTYVQALKSCTGRNIRSFSDLRGIIQPDALQNMIKMYNSVEDIDLFIGGNFETRKITQRVGPTFQCIMAQQFYQYKFGDRFWYEVKGQPHSLTIDQLKEIRKTSMSRIICDNSDDIDRIAKNVFIPPGFIFNTLYPCKRIKSINLRKWAQKT